MNASQTYIVYVDDSGAADTGHIIYGWLAVPIAQWNAALKAVLSWRHQLDASYQIPVTYELQATKFVGGRGRPTRTEDGNLAKSTRAAIVASTFDELAAWDWATIGAVHAHTHGQGRRYHQAKEATYDSLVHEIDHWLNSTGSQAVIVMDGDGTDKGFARAHRGLRLATRHIVEDPLFLDSATSQWVQLADLIAFAAYQHILQRTDRSFAWSWYPSLSHRDAFRGVREV